MTLIPRRDLEHLVMLASRAPSIHNSQPWTLVPRDEGVWLYADRTRQLHVLDPDGRQLTVSCGAALHHLEVAAEAMGFEVTSTLLPDDQDRDLLANVHLTRTGHATPEEVQQAVDVLHRHTHRGRFEDEPLPAGLLDRLRCVVENQGAMLRVLHRQETVMVAVLAEHAERDLLRTPGYAEELAHWVWPEGTIDLRTDGLPAEAVEAGEGRAESVPGRHFVPAATKAPVETPAAEHPALVLITTVADTPQDWLLAGKAMSALLLKATHEGVAAQPLGQVIDVPSTRAELRHELGVIGVPQMLLRLGVAAGHPQTPRRPVDEVLKA